MLSLVFKFSAISLLSLFSLSACPIDTCSLRGYINSMTKTCEVCNQPFSATRSNARFCSGRCRKRNHRLPKKHVTSVVVKTEHYIYAILCPYTRDVVYIGQTGNLNKRRYAHMSESRRSSAHPLYVWIKSLGEVEPLFKVLHETDDGEDANRLEECWIAHHTNKGHILFNIAKGGSKHVVKRVSVLDSWLCSYV